MRASRWWLAAWAATVLVCLGVFFVLAVPAVLASGFLVARGRPGWAIATVLVGSFAGLALGLVW